LTTPYFIPVSKRFILAKKRIDVTDEKISFHLTSKESLFYSDSVPPKEPGVKQETIVFNSLESAGLLAEWLEWVGWRAPVVPIFDDVDSEMLKLREKVIEASIQKEKKGESKVITHHMRMFTLKNVGSLSLTVESLMIKDEQGRDSQQFTI
jgi:hypothetical protein